MTATIAIILGGLAMSAIALVGSVTLLLSQSTLDRLIRPLVALAAGSLLGGAFFHMLPAAAAQGVSPISSAIGVMIGFSLFLSLEQFLHWHHCRREGLCEAGREEHRQEDREGVRESGAESAGSKAPHTYLILLGDGLHNFLGGLGVGGVMLLDLKLGMTAWLAAAAHEVPQELGDFGVLVHGGWRKGPALLFNLLSGLSFLLGGLVSILLAESIDVALLVPFAAGNFLYIGASDLVPEMNRHQSQSLESRAIELACFLAGVGLLGGIGWMLRT